MNPWLYSFLVTFILLLLFIDWKQINKNIYGGIVSALFIQTDSILGTKLGLFKFHLVPLNMPDIFLFSNTLNIFYTGIAFNIGIIMVQLQPRKLGYQLINALIWVLFLMLFYILIDKFSLIDYLKFKPYFIVRQFMLFLFLAWIKNSFILKNYAQGQ